MTQIVIVRLCRLLLEQKNTCLFLILFMLWKTTMNWIWMEYSWWTDRMICIVTGTEECKPCGKSSPDLSLVNIWSLEDPAYDWPRVVSFACRQYHTNASAVPHVGYRPFANVSHPKIALLHHNCLPGFSRDIVIVDTQVGGCLSKQPPVVYPRELHHVWSRQDNTSTIIYCSPGVAGGVQSPWIWWATGNKSRFRKWSAY